MGRGCIVVGYQGIGKSTLANENLHCIDLESSNFWYKGQRPEDWYVFYSNIAVDLAKQGYVVFTSSHEVVRHELAARKLPEGVYLLGVVPNESLKDQWIEKLHDRYNTSMLEKDFKAWKNAEDRFTDNIREIKSDLSCVCEYTEMDQNLKSTLQRYFSFTGWDIYI